MTEDDSTRVRGLSRVLVVDDDVALATGLRHALENQGYVVRVLDRGTQVLETVATFKPDLLVLDVMMPIVDGWEVLARLRASEGAHHVPVIMLTAADTDAAKVKGFALGADDYLTKPFSVQELRCRIAAVLRRSRPRLDGEERCLVPVVVGGSRVEFVECRDVYYVEGVRNYTYVHTADARFLSRLTLGAFDEKDIPGFRRVHRSFIVNLEHVKGCGWTNKSSYRLTLNDLDRTHIPVSRAQVAEVQRLLGLRP
jgi:DNA-binding LytR/AlgR family response regulator